MPDYEAKYHDLLHILQEFTLGWDLFYRGILGQYQMEQRMKKIREKLDKEIANV